MLFGLAHDDSRHGGVVVTFNDFLRSEGQPPRLPSSATYDIAPTGQFADLVVEPIVIEPTPDMIGFARELHQRLLVKAMAPYFNALNAQTGGGKPAYDENDCCTGCGAHISEGCDDDCPRNPKDQRDEALAELRDRRPHCNLSGPCEPGCPGDPTIAAAYILPTE
jgi:hypothetical protein